MDDICKDNTPPLIKSQTWAPPIWCWLHFVSLQVTVLCCLEPSSPSYIPWDIPYFWGATISCKAMSQGTNWRTLLSPALQTLCWDWSERNSGNAAAGACSKRVWSLPPEVKTSPPTWKPKGDSSSGFLWVSLRPSPQILWALAQGLQCLVVCAFEYLLLTIHAKTRCDNASLLYVDQHTLWSSH